MTTPRKTRAPRKPNPFRMTYTLATTLPLHMRDAMIAANPKMSPTIRAALLKYAHKAKTIKVPDTHRPPAQFDQQTTVSAVVKPDSLRQEYEHHASIFGITMSELILRCLYAYLKGEIQGQNT